jgi:excisionase family DNA binding protein
MPADTIPPLRLEIPEAAQALRISRAMLYKRIKAGDIAAQKDGKRAFITEAELRRYVERLSKPRAA